MNNLQWYWVYIPYLDQPERQHEPAVRADYGKVYLKSDVDAEIRRVKRALWLARANYCHNFRIDWYIKRHPNTKRCHLTMENTLTIAELKCRAKAKEYK